jgi:hypothetical protein
LVEDANIKFRIAMHHMAKYPINVFAWHPLPLLS